MKFVLSSKELNFIAEIGQHFHICLRTPCFGGRIISFLVKFESSILFILVAYFGHLGYCIPHLMNKKADFWCKVLEKWTLKTEKMRKCPKTADFGHVLVYSSN